MQHPEWTADYRPPHQIHPTSRPAHNPERATHLLTTHLAVLDSLA
jgi:hypothetical protein